MSIRRNLGWRYLVVLIGVSFVLRAVVAWFACATVPLMSTAANYVAVGEQLLRTFPGVTPHYWPPGLPYVLALVFTVFEPAAWSARIVSVAASTLVVPLVALAGLTLFDSPSAARRAGWMAAFYPPALMWVGQPNTHHLAALIMLAVFIGLWSSSRSASLLKLAVAGLLAGFGCLVRPSVQAVVLVVAVWLLSRWSGRSARTGKLLAAGIWLAVVLSVVVPVAAFNAAFGAGWMISTNNERNFFLGNNPHTPIYKTGHLAQRPKMEGLSPETKRYLVSVYGSEHPRRTMMKQALNHIADQPGLALRRVLSRARSFWGFDYVASRQMQIHLGLSPRQLAPLLLLEAGGYSVVMVLALFSLLVARRWERGPMVLVLVLVFGYMAPYLIVFATGTYHFAVMGLVIAVAGGGLSAGWSQGRDQVRGPRGLAFFAAVAVFVVIQFEYAYHAIANLPG